MTVVDDTSLELTEVRGPSALGGGWRRSLELLYLIASNEFKRTYFGTVLGYLWSLCRPLLLFAVMYTVFTHIVKLGKAVPDYPVLLLFNIVLFGFFQEATSTSVGSVVAQEAIVRKTQFPRIVIPLSVVLTAGFNLGLNLIVAFIFILAYGVSPMWTWLLLPVLLLWLFTLTTAISMLLSSLYPRFRDMGIIWGVFVTALFYATPVLYPLDKVSGTLATVISWNPLTPLFEFARKWIIDPERADQDGGLGHRDPARALGLDLRARGLVVFNREAPRIAEEL